MGVNACLTFSPGARVDDVADAIGVLAGLPAVTDNKGFRRVAGVTVKSTSVPQSPRILLRGRMVDGSRVHEVMFHYEGCGGRPSIAPPSTAFWVAVCRRLVGFFGGRLDYNDCDSRTAGYRRPCPRRRNDPQDGAAWQKFEREMDGVRPVTVADVARAGKYAYYKEN
jgi:hypothetical protein